MTQAASPHRSIAWRVKRKALHALRPSTYWSLMSWNEQRALWTTIKVRDPELFDRRSRELASQLEPFVTSDSVVLDIGCGIGRPQRYLAPHVKHIHGADISSRMLSIARQRHQDVSNVSWHRTDGASFTFARNDSIDFAFSELVFQHVDKPKVVRLWADLFRVMRPGGRVYLQLLNLECLYLRRGYIQSALDMDLTPGDVRLWTTLEVRAVAEQLGWIVESVEVADDYRAPDGSRATDALHAGYSIWLTAHKPGTGAAVAAGPGEPASPAESTA